MESELPVGVRAELKGLPKDLAETVGAHIWAAGQLVDVDPDLAFRHAEAARRRAGRLPIVREAAAETAYAAGEYAVALREFRAIRRMSGGDELIPVIADCERALGRPRDALEVLGELDPKSKDIWLRIECLLVEAGVRADLGQTAEAMRLLQAAISRKVGPPFGQARLRYAYANLLEQEGNLEGAREWFSSAAALDLNTELDTADRIAHLDGVVLPDFDIEDEDDLGDEVSAEEDDDSSSEDDIDDEDDIDEDDDEEDLDDVNVGDAAESSAGDGVDDGAEPDGEPDEDPVVDAELGDEYEEDDPDYDEPSVPSPAVDDDVERVADDGDTVDDDADDSEEKD